MDHFQNYTRPEDRRVNSSCNVNVESSRGKFLFGPHFRKSDEYIERNNIYYNLNEYDYVVEKLIVKRVPIALYAILPNRNETQNQHESTDSLDNNMIIPPKTSTVTPAIADSISVYSMMPEAHPVLQLSKGKCHGNMFRRESANGKFNMDARNTYDYKDLKIEREEGMEILHRLTALHPDLKESERPPKDPCSLAIERHIPPSRSFADGLTEIASTTTQDRKLGTSADRSHLRGNHRKMRSVSTSVELDTQYVKTGLSKLITPTPNTNKSERRSRTKSISRLISSCYKGSNVPSEFRRSIRLERVDEKSLPQVNDHCAPRSFDKTTVYTANPIVSPKTQSKASSISISSTRLQRLLSKFSAERRAANLQDSFLDLTEPKVQSSGCPDETEQPEGKSSIETLLRWRIVIKHNYPLVNIRTDDPRQALRSTITKNIFADES